MAQRSRQPTHVAAPNTSADPEGAYASSVTFDGNSGLLTGSRIRTSCSPLSSCVLVHRLGLAMPDEVEAESNNATDNANTQAEDPPQCRICLDGEDPELGRLIRPCLCKGSVSVCIYTIIAVSLSLNILHSMCM